MKKILSLGLASLICYHWISFFRFSHPYPKHDFYIVILGQFGISFISYSLSPKFGRVITIISALTLVRLASILGIQSPIVTLMGVFWGAISGKLFNEIFTLYLNRNKEQTDTVKLPLLFNTNLVLILFLIVLTLDRFLVYFNAPYFKGFGILETMYVSGVSSKEAFALSMESISNLLFPLLYIYSEEIIPGDKEDIQDDWKLGAFIGLLINAVVILLQILWNRELLAANTNLSLDAGRVMGLLRDSGSSSWIIPILCFLFYKDLVKSKKFFYVPLLCLILFQIFIGSYQGRIYWIMLLFGLVSLIIILISQNKIIISMKSLIPILIGALLLVFILYQVPRVKDSSFDRVMSIPNKLVSSFETKDNPLREIDTARYYLNRAGWNLFLQNPFFGTGIGSFIVNLKDPSLQIYTYKKEIDNPSLFIGALSEIGILGVILIIIYSWNRFRSNHSFLVLILLFPAFLTGYQILHPDGAFVLMLVIVLGFGLKEENDRITNQIKILGCILVFLFFCNSMFHVFQQESLPEFRKEKLNSYQLLAYELNKGSNGNNYHIFKGKTIWAIADVNAIELDVFLDNSTSKDSLKQKWSVLDRNRNSILEIEILVQKKSPYLHLLKLPENSHYIQVEELDMNGRLQIYGDVPFCIPTTHFTEKNEFL